MTETYKPIGRLFPNSPLPTELQAYLSIFHNNAEVPLATFCEDGADNGYIEAIAGLLQKRTLAIKVREGIGAVVYKRLTDRSIEEIKTPTVSELSRAENEGMIPR